jgi:hypothetical protein
VALKAMTFAEGKQFSGSVGCKLLTIGTFGQPRTASPSIRILALGLLSPAICTDFGSFGCSAGR